MRSNDVFKMWVLRRVVHQFLIEDVFPILRGYLFYDRSSMMFARNVAQKRQTLLSSIHYSQSRRNGFHHQEENNTEHPHWIFCCPDVHVVLQAISCPICGNYILSNTPHLSPQARCQKHHAL